MIKLPPVTLGTDVPANASTMPCGNAVGMGHEFRAQIAEPAVVVIPEPDIKADDSADCSRRKELRESRALGFVFNSSDRATQPIAKGTYHPAKLVRLSSAGKGTRARTVVLPAGRDVTESSPFTNCTLSRMLMSPKLRPLKALCWSKPMS